ncbi:MAG: hypothetical protein AAGE05_15650 [Pseudomonadota bacterium]
MIETSIYSPRSVRRSEAERFPLVSGDSEDRIPMPGTPKTDSES